LSSTPPAKRRRPGSGEEPGGAGPPPAARPGGGDAEVDLVTCFNCGRSVPSGEYCGSCGAHLVSQSTSSARRQHAFAADPGEHVLHLTLVSTLLPHLPHRSSLPFRIGFLVLGGLLVALGLVRLTGPAIALASVGVLVLYLLYLYEVEVYEDEPILVLAVTVLLGLLLGAAWAYFTGPSITQDRILNITLGPSAATVFVPGVLLPLLAQLLMLAGAMVMYTRRHFDETLDGFTFGAACALGFTFGSTLVDLFPELQQGPFSDTPAVTNALQIVQHGLLIPIINASTTGLIAGALWLRRGKVRAEARGLPTSLAVAIAVAVLVQAGRGVTSVLATSTLTEVLVYAVLALALLVWVRLALHHMLLAEAVEVAVGPPNECSHCHRIVPRMAFCPNCGIATRATPKTGAGRLARAVR
jgi:RsiW-degrading membrane proteinase PrsW (M82 family)